MSYQQFKKVISLPPDPPRINNINYICIKYCPNGLDHLIFIENLANSIPKSRSVVDTYGV